MADLKREKLSKGKKITLKELNTKYPFNFEIISSLTSKETKEGGSAICYLAECNGERGRLKEFYPCDNKYEGIYYNLKRNKNNQLIPEGDAQEIKFYSACADFIKAYDKIKEAKSKDKKHNILNNYMPSGVLYRGFDGAKEGSVYVWTKDDKEGVTFDEYIRSIHRSPRKLSAHKLYNVIEVVKSLTEFLMALHSACLLHLDLKPSNFLINYNAQYEINPNSISVFDINSIYDLDGRPLFAGTDGFRAPELYDISRNGEIYLGTDIYSVGAILYNALFSTKKENVTYKNNGELNDIENRIAECELIKYSQCNSDEKIRYRLAEILKKCLAEDIEDRYSYCAELREALVSVQNRILSHAKNETLPINEKLKYIDSDVRSEVNPTAVIQNLLYNYPIYTKELNNVSKREDGLKTINVLTVGAGEYARQFIDQCLQCGQMVDTYLKITAISNECAEDKAVYLSNRKALKDFVNIDNEYENPIEQKMYADLSFKPFDINDETIKLSPEIKTNSKSLDSAIDSLCLYNETVDYIFVALGDDKWNVRVAQKLYDYYKDNGTFISYTTSDKNKKPQKNLVPVFIDEKINLEDIAPSLEQMAFNVHLSWNNNLNVSIADERKRFKDKYNYNSSLAAALSIKYKLHSIGIESDDLNFAVKQFNKFKKNYFNKLIALEHRRWVLEKVCDGWTCLDNLEECLEHPHNDKKRKKHVCILKGNENLELSEGVLKNHKNWDTAEEKELSPLDPLDRMSVELHQKYKEKADEVIQGNVLSGEYASKIKSLISSSKQSKVAFLELISCMKLINNGVDSKTKNYRALMIAFENTLNNFSASIADEVKSNLKMLDKLFQPILKSKEYVDYKKKDADIINHIPFILTYTNNKHIVVPFSFGSSNNDFMNVSSAILINPSDITYLACANTIDDLKQINVSISNTYRLLDKMNIHANIRFYLAYQSSLSKFNKVFGKIESELNAGNVKRFRTLEFNMPEDITQLLIDELNNSIDVDAIEINESKISYLFIGAGIIRKYPCYKLNVHQKKLESINACDFIEYINGEQYIKVEDVFAVDDSRDDRNTPPEFYNDYKKLWGIYRDDSKAWKLMCSLLAKHSDLTDYIFKMQLSKSSASDYEDMRLILPYFTYDSVNKILDFLINGVKVISNKSSVSYYNNESCEVIINAPKQCLEKIKGIFKNPHLLTDRNSISCINKNYSIYISNDNLITGIIDFGDGNYSEFKNNSSRIKTVLKKLNDINLINIWNNESTNENTIGFTYSSRAVKDLLTNAGRILEIAVYHKCLDFGAFDDIANSYEVSWQGSEIKNEFDIVATKGFRSFFIECKAVNDISHEYYYKIKALTDQFGINAVPVIIADAPSNQSNSMQKHRGEMMGVITIDKKEDIDNIGSALAEALRIKS
ncbi:MAG: hypothetical protein J1E81_02485 [Eubacterium sp.]|nr:hypothetical protein [Eubacterium sp.]